jgi:hypothetical protein
MRTQHKSKKIGPFTEGSRDLTCAIAFYLSSRDKNCFERWLSLSTNGNGVLAIFHTKQVESGSEFWKNWHLHALL